jgi:hypothetical protein
MRIFELDKIDESVGFPNRKPGDTFVNPMDSADVVKFDELILLPLHDTGEIKYDSVQDMESDLEELRNQYPDSEFYMLNQAKNSLLSLYIVKLTNADNQSEFYVLYVRDLAKPSGKLTAIPPGIKTPTHGGYNFGSKISTSERISIKPSQVLPNEGPFSIEDIIRYLEKASGLSDVPDDLIAQMTGYLSSLASGQDHVIPNGVKYESIHQKYLGEYAAPFAVSLGYVENIATLKQAENALLSGDKWQSMNQAIFPASTSGMLIDSIMTNGTVNVGVSSKAAKGGGAAASLGGIYDVILKNQDNPEFKSRVLDVYPEIIKVIEDIVTMTAVEGLFYAATELELIDKADLTRLEQMRTSVKQGQDRAENKMSKLTPNLRRFTKEIGADTSGARYSVFFHVTAGLAKAVGQQLNAMPIEAAIKEILNFATMVQVYMTTQRVGEDLIVKPFKFVWPPEYEGTVGVDYSKNFTSSEIRGKLSFKFK